MVSREFMDNVQNGNVYRVRSVLLDYLIIDRTFKTFDEALEYASRTMDVVQKYDNEPFVLDKDKWNMRYLNVQKATLMMNFAPERIQHLKDVITHLDATGATPNTAESSERKNSKPVNRNIHTGRTVIRETELSQSSYPQSILSQRKMQRSCPKEKPEGHKFLKKCFRILKLKIKEESRALM